MAEGKKKRGLSGPSNSDRAGQRHLFITFYFMGGRCGPNKNVVLGARTRFKLSAAPLR